MQPTNKSVTSYEQLHKSIHEVRQSLKEILDSLPKLPPVDSVLNLSTVPSQLHKKQRRYSLLFMPKPASLAVSIPGLGQLPLMLKPGWTELSMPDGTELALVSGNVSALYRCADTLE